jgi:hypothetical protein
MRFSARLQSMARNEIEELVGRSAIEQIRKKDPHPLFLAFAVGHEGDANGNLIGLGNVVKKWFRDTVRRLYEKIKNGLEVFSGHVEDSNSHFGREPIGRVVAKQLIDDYYGQTVVAICYIYPEYRSQRLDVASIEADLDIDLEGDGQLVVRDVREITGIALGNSQYNRPGFPGATLLGQLQAFGPKETTLKLSPDELRHAIQEAGLRPQDLFDPDDLDADPPDTRRSREKGNTADTAAERTFYENRELRRQLADARQKLTKAETDMQALNAKVVEHETTIASHAKTVAMSRAKGELFEKAARERKLDDRQKKFVQARLDKFAVQKPEDVDKEFSTYLDHEIDELRALEQDVFGIKPPTPEQKDKGTGPSDNPPATDVPDALDPAKNPFIPKFDLL